MSCSCDNNPLILPVGATGPQGPQGEPGFGFEHFVGEELDGGVVFHVYRDSLGEEHGLICSIINQTISSQYSSIANALAGANSYWNGPSNTTLLKTQGGISGTGAWKYADDYSHGGFTDWYLPSIDELSLLCNNRYNVNKTLSTIVGSTQLNFFVYWSSTETDFDQAYAFRFEQGDSYTDNKIDTFAVRAVRQF